MKGWSQTDYDRHCCFIYSLSQLVEQIISYMIILAGNKSQMIITGLFLRFCDEIFLLQDKIKVNSKIQFQSKCRYLCGVISWPRIV